MPDSSAERTEQATSKKKQDERKKGNVFTSRDVNTLVTLIVSFYAFRIFAGSLLAQITDRYEKQMELITSLNTLHIEEVKKIFIDIGIMLFTTTIPAMLIAAAASVFISLFQTRGLFTYESIKFKFSRLSLLNGFKKFFSLRSLVELAKSIAKIIVLIWIIYNNVMDVILVLPSMVDWDIMQALVYIGESVMSIMLSVALAYGIIAAIDFFYQRYEYEKGIRMTKQEVKEEWKQMEGDPHIKSKRRQKQQELAQRRMMQQVKDADVIVRNPTHYAVALKYIIDKDPAPMVLAKGSDHVAQRIVDEALKYNIATVENKSLARGLYENADLFDFIPAEFFQPVAELLAWLYSTKEKTPNKAPSAAARPVVAQGLISDKEKGNVRQ